MATNITTSETEEERDLENLRKEWLEANIEWWRYKAFPQNRIHTNEEWCEVKRLRLWRTEKDFEDYLKKQAPRQILTHYSAILDVQWDVTQKLSETEPYLSLGGVKVTYGMFENLTTQTTKSKNSNRRGINTKYTKSKNSNRRGINTKYTEKIMFDIPQGTKELHVRLRNKKKLFFDDLITSKKVKLENLLRNGYDKITWEFFDKDGRRGVATLVLQEISADAANNMPEGSTTMQNEYGYASYIGSKSGNAFNCTKQ